MDRPCAKTDWDLYYERPYKAASVTRGITARRLLRQIGRFAPPSPRICELGGANSCFFDTIQREIRPKEYHVVDNNRVGLERFRRRTEGMAGVFAHEQDVLKLTLEERFDVVFSVGLIEHFDTAGTAQAIDAHFKLLADGRIALISFPTPTFLYRAARRAAEACGAWVFHDERPLELQEVQQTAGRQGELLHHEVIWPIVLTQYLGVWRKV